VIARLTHCIAALAVLSAAALTTTPAEADEWTGRDKTLHAIGGALVAGSVKEATGSKGLALAAGGIVAVGKELADMRMPGHTPSHKDAIVTFAAAALSVSIPGLRIGPGWIAYRTEF
jgi:uncharacterized protein YfiM (DUF2279 family)